MKRYKVETRMLRVETYTSYVWAPDEAEAEVLADQEIQDGLEGEDEGLETSVRFDELDVNAPHKVVHGSSYDPERFNEQICKVCDRKLVWTGQNYDDPRNTTGETIPGPWVHEAEVNDERADNRA